MRPSALLTTAALSLLVAAVPAGADDIPQEARKGMEQAMMQLGNKGLMTTQEGLERSIGKEKLDRFLAGSVARLVLSPDGTWAAETLEGGEVIGFSLGGDEHATDGEAEPIAGGKWSRKQGELELPKRSEKVTLKLRAGANEVEVECYNEYVPSEDPVTFHVGPLAGLFCIGLAAGG